MHILIYTTQKKFRISCAYFFVLSTSNSCRLWRGWQIKVQFSEDVSCMTISNFCEKQFVLNDTTIKNHFFDPKIQNFINFMFNQCLYYYCVKFYQNWYNGSCFIMFYTVIPTPKTGKFSKVVTFEKSMLYPRVHKIPFISIMQSIWCMF